MEAKTAKKVAAALRNLLGDTTAGTAVVIETTIYENQSYVEIKPAKTNETGSFFHAEELVDICRVFKVSEWIGAEKDENGTAYVYAHIY